MPTRPQRQWLIDHGLQAGWVDADGDCAFAATVGTVGPSRIAGAMREISGQAGLPEPDLARQPVTGRDLRMFLADVIEHVRAASNADLIQRLGLDFFPDVSDDRDVPSLPTLLAGLRELGDYSERRGGNSFSQLLHNLLRLGGVRLGWISDVVGQVVAGPAGEREQYTIVLINEHYLPTRERAGAEPDEPQGTPAEPLGWVASVPPWRLRDDGCTRSSSPGAASRAASRAAGRVPGPDRARRAAGFAHPGAAYRRRRPGARGAAGWGR